MRQPKPQISHQQRLGRARAAGMAAATRGRARTFESVRPSEFDDTAEQIAEALEDRGHREQMASDYAGLA